MGLSDLKKRLPEAAFGKRNYIDNEGGCDEYSASRADGHGVVPGQGSGQERLEKATGILDEGAVEPQSCERVWRK